MKYSTAILRSAAASVLVTTLAVPAFAGESSDSQKTELTYNAKSGKYCVKAVFTGTRMAKTICRTKEEWASRDVIIPENAATEIAKK